MSEKEATPSLLQQHACLVGSSPPNSEWSLVTSLGNGYVVVSSVSKTVALEEAGG